MIAIQVRDVRKTYRRYGRRKSFGTLKSALLSGGLLRDLRPDQVFDALKGVSFDVTAGRTFGVIGRNGSGKSTMLKMIAGIGKPSSGTVHVNGRVSALDRARRRLPPGDLRPGQRLHQRHDARADRGARSPAASTRSSRSPSWSSSSTRR